MRVLSADEFEKSKPWLRRSIPGLFDEVAPSVQPLYPEKFVHPASLFGAMAVQRLAGGELRPVLLDSSMMPADGRSDIRRHVVNFVHGKVFDIFGFISTRAEHDMQRVYDQEPLAVDDGLVIRVEGVLEPLRYKLGLPTEVLK